MKKVKNAMHKTALSGVASYRKTHPMANLSKELPKKSKTNRLRKGTAKSSKAG